MGTLLSECVDPAEIRESLLSESGPSITNTCTQNKTLGPSFGSRVSKKNEGGPSALSKNSIRAYNTRQLKESDDETLLGFYSQQPDAKVWGRSWAV